MKKKVLAGMLAAVLAVTMLGACGASKPAEQEKQSEAAQQTESEAVTEAESETAAEDETEDVVVRVGAMVGPTAMGMVKLMEDSAAGTTLNKYDFADLAEGASAMVTPIATGELDIAAVPSNLAAVLYKNTDGAVQVLAVNTQGVLYLLSKDENVKELADLAGKTVAMTGKGAVPEFTTSYILAKNGVEGVEYDFSNEGTEVIAKLTKGEADNAILPMPAALAAMGNVEGLNMVKDLNAEWQALDAGCDIATGVVVVRKEFAEANPEAVANFLKEYEASVAYTNENAADAAVLIEKYGIVAKAALAEKAIPKCHLTFLAGADMKANLSGFYQVLFDQEPSAVGGALPADDFYYGAN